MLQKNHSCFIFSRHTVFALSAVKAAILHGVAQCMLLTNLKKSLENLFYVKYKEGKICERYTHIPCGADMKKTNWENEKLSLDKT